MRVGHRGGDSGARGRAAKKLIALSALYAESEDELRADLQQCYGIDLDDAMAGGHSAAHVAALAAQLPHDARVWTRWDPDRQWGLEHVLLASILNSLNMLIWGMGDRRRRGRRPRPVGPGWMTKGRTRRVAKRAVTIEQLKEELSRPRAERRNDG